MSVDEEEGAYLDLELTGGQQYILVVGSDGTGPYELTIKVVRIRLVPSITIVAVSSATR